MTGILKGFFRGIVNAKYMSIMAHKTLSAYKKPEIYLRTFKLCMHKLLKFDRRLVNLAFQFVTFIDYFQCVFSGGIFRTI